MEIKTDPEEFERFYNTLTSERDDYEPFIFPLTVSDKDPQSDISWKNNKVDLKTAKKLLKHGVNIGIAATSDDNLVIVDVDDMEAVGKFKKTFTCASRKRIGRHAFYFTDDVISEDLTVNTSKQNIAVDDVGEVRANWQYVVAPGSYVPVSQEKYDAIPEDDKINAGKYSIVENIAVSHITFKELPDVFLQRINEQRTIDEFNKNKPPKEFVNKEGQEHSAMFDLRIEDVIRSPVKDGKRFPSVFHGSDTGKNTTVNNGLLHCFRCNVAHSPLTALAVMAGVDTCSSAGYGHRGTGQSSINFDDGHTILKMWTYAKRNGIIPKDDKIPTKALLSFSIDNDICVESDIIEGWKIQPELYNRTLQKINDEGIISGRKQLKINPPIMNDWGRAKVFTLEHRGNIKYSHTMKSWYIWNGQQWLIDTTGAIYQCAKSTIKNMYSSILPNIEDQDNRKRFLVQLIKAENQNFLKSMLESASNEPMIPIDVSSFDSRKDLINVNNGIVDLKSGRLIDHEKSMMMSKQLSVNYNKTAKCDRWLDFLNTTFAGDEALIDFIKRFLGYSLTGYTDEQVFCIFYGHGSNGKGTMIDTITNIMGEYAKVTEPETIIKKKYERASTNDLADLWGSRFVVTSETESYQELDEGRIKRITGQDKIKCRFLYKDLFEYYPEYKLVLLTNHEPIIKSQDYSIWRRVLKVPFNVKLPREQWNLKLRDELLEERDGIFTWLVDGAIAWHKDGLQIPESVTKATEEYKDELDVIGDFLSMCTDQNENTQVRNRDLYKCYEHWCTATLNKPYAANTFSRAIIERGFENTKISGVRGKHGIDIKPDIKILMNNGTFCKDLDKIPLCAVEEPNEVWTASCPDGIDENASMDGWDGYTPLFEKSLGLESNKKRVQKNGLEPSEPSTDSEKKTVNRPFRENDAESLNTVSKSEEDFRSDSYQQRVDNNEFESIDMNYLTKVITHYKNANHPNGVIPDYGRFALIVYNQSKELKGVVTVEQIEQLTRKLAKDGWK